MYIVIYRILGNFSGNVIHHKNLTDLFLEFLIENSIFFEILCNKMTSFYLFKKLWYTV